MTIHDSLDDLGRLLESYKQDGAGENELMEQLAMNLMRQTLMPRFCRTLMLQAESERQALLETVAGKLLPPPIPQPTQIYSDADHAIDDCEREGTRQTIQRKMPQFLDAWELQKRAVNGSY